MHLLFSLKIILFKQVKLIKNKIKKENYKKLSITIKRILVSNVSLLTISSKYRSMFLRETTRVTQDKINYGEYELINLN